MLAEETDKSTDGDGAPNKIETVAIIEPRPTKTRKPMKNVVASKGKI